MLGADPSPCGFDDPTDAESEPLFRDRFVAQGSLVDWLLIEAYDQPKVTGGRPQNSGLLKGKLKGKFNDTSTRIGSWCQSRVSAELERRVKHGREKCRDGAR